MLLLHASIMAPVVLMGNVYAMMDTTEATAQVNWFYFHCFKTRSNLFPLPKVSCNATTTCNGHGSCTNDGDCKCDDGFYAADCSGILSLNDPIIKTFFEFWIALSNSWVQCCPKLQWSRNLWTKWSLWMWRRILHGGLFK